MAERTTLKSLQSEIAALRAEIAALKAAAAAQPAVAAPTELGTSAGKPLRPNYFFKVVGDIARGDYTEAKRAVNAVNAKFGVEAAQRLRRTLWARAKRSNAKPAATAAA
jgi:hypothetical protein